MTNFDSRIGHTPEQIYRGRRVFVNAYHDLDGKLVVWVSQEHPVASPEFPDLEVYPIKSTLKYEDFNLEEGIFKRPADWLVFAKRTGAEPMPGKSEEQGELLICSACNTLNTDQDEFCISCNRALKLPNGF